MYTRVAAARVGFAVARALAAAKFVPGVTGVGPTRVWVEKYADHIASTTARPAATIERIDLVVVASDLVAG